MNLLIMEDDFSLRHLLTTNIEGIGGQAVAVQAVEDTIAAIPVLMEQTIHGVLLDHRGDDIEIVEMLTHAPIIILTGSEDVGYEKTLNGHPVYQKPQGYFSAIAHLIQAASAFYFEQELESGTIEEDLIRAGHRLMGYNP